MTTNPTTATKKPTASSFEWIRSTHIKRLILAAGLSSGLWYMNTDSGHKSTKITGIDFVQTEGGNAIFQFSFLGLTLGIGWTAK